MIPKKIHYFWFGGNEKPKSVVKCIDSWKKYCPDYEINEWNETNFDVHCMPFVEQAYEAKKYAFVSDVARLIVVYEQGGIYMDTDVEVLKPLDDLLDNYAYMSFENEYEQWFEENLSEVESPLEYEHNSILLNNIALSILVDKIIYFMI